MPLNSQDNASLQSLEDEVSLADLHTVAAGSIVFLATLPLILFVIRPFPIGSTGAALIGAVLMVCSKVLSQDEVYDLLSKKEHIGTLSLLAGVLIIGQYVDREGIAVRVFRYLLDSRQSFNRYALSVCLIVSVSSAFLTSDVSCLLISPVVLRIWKHHERPGHELECLLLIMVVSAVFGGSFSLYGHTHTAFIYMKSLQSNYTTIDFGLFQSLIYIGLPSLIGLGLNVCLILLLYRLKNHRIEKSKLMSSEPHSEQELAGLTTRNLTCKLNGFRSNGLSIGENNAFSYEGLTSSESERASVPCQLETIHEDEVLEITSSSRTISFRDEINISESSSSDEDEDKCESNLSRSSPQMLLEQLDRLDDSLDVVYTPNGLQSSASIRAECEPSLQKHPLEPRGYRVVASSDLFYRSFSGFSPVCFLVTSDVDGDTSEDSSFRSSDSQVFHAVLLFSLLLMVTLSMLTSVVGSVTIDLGKNNILREWDCAVRKVFTSDFFVSFQPSKGRTTYHIMIYHFIQPKLKYCRLFNPFKARYTI